MGSDKKGGLTGITSRTNQAGQDFRKETKLFRRRLRDFLMKKGYEKGGVSLQRAYRKLIRILDDWYRKGM